jgi:hypothetical protein
MRCFLPWAKSVYSAARISGRRLKSSTRREEARARAVSSSAPCAHSTRPSAVDEEDGDVALRLAPPRRAEHVEARTASRAPCAALGGGAGVSGSKIGTAHDRHRLVVGWRGARSGRSCCRSGARLGEGIAQRHAGPARRARRRRATARALEVEHLQRQQPPSLSSMKLPK